MRMANDNPGVCQPDHVVSIREWTTSYYVNSKKKWLYGRLVLTQHGVIFIQNSDPAQKAKSADVATFQQSIPFSSFINVRKTTSSLIFPVVIVATKTERHWFGSFLDRDSVYNSLLHFWKTHLIPENEKQSAAPKAKTRLGKELLNLAYDSQKTLSQAAETLHEQGQQIDITLDTMDDLHNDLDVADRVVSGLESWIGRWSAASNVPVVDPVILKSADFSDVTNFEILYAKGISTLTSSFSPGTLWISRKEGVTIMGEKEEIIQHFGGGKNTLSRITVLSPWEIMLSSFRIGEPDLTYYIFSAKAVHLLKQLEFGRTSKIEYSSPSPTYVATHNQSESRSQILSQPELLPLGKSSQRASNIGRLGPDKNGQHMQQQQQHAGPMSEEEVKDLSDMLSDLKTMAIAVQKEENQQLENLDTLMTSVDRANIRLTETNKRVNTLLKK